MTVCGIRWGARWAALVGWGLAAGTVQAAGIASVSPTGEASRVRQVQVRFDTAVVPQGDSRLPDPVSIRCTGPVPQGSGRWVDARSWVYDFREVVPPGVRCQVGIRSDWKPMASAGALTTPGPFSFGSGGPAVVGVAPYEGATIEEDQHFLLRLNGPAQEAGVPARVWCEVDGIGERLPVAVVTGAARDAVLKLRRVPAERAASSLLLRCSRPLPGDTAVRLVWSPGVPAAADPRVLSTERQSFEFRVRAPFAVDFSCERERAEAACLPVRPMSLRFSAPVARELAAKVRLVPATGAAMAPTVDQDDRRAEVESISFPVPLPEQARFKIELPKDLRDTSGRPLSNAASYPLSVATGAAPPIAKFAAAPFGIIESTDPVLPVTLRHVQAELRPAGAAASGAAVAKSGVRVRRIDTDEDIQTWFNRLERYHESAMTAREAGLPRSQWTVVEREQDARGKTIERRVDRVVGTRELSLLKSQPDARRLDLPQLVGGDPRPFEVVGIPLDGPGYHVVEIESPRLGASLLSERGPMYVRTGVLVTNLGVHFKLGRENSLVWVTSLDRGRPVASASVAVHDCRGKRLWTGTTDAQGLAPIRLALDPSMGECPGLSAFFVTARQVLTEGPHQGRSDVGFVMSAWQKGIEPWRFNHPTASGPQLDLRAHTVLDRTLLRAGETVSMKHLIRLETGQGLAQVPTADLPTRLRIVHQGSGQDLVQPITWRDDRSALSTWNIPPTAKLGSYEVVLERDARGDRRGPARWTSGEFRVEEFRVPLIDARLSAPKSVPVAPKALPMSLQLNHLSGGAVASAPVRVTALLKGRSVRFEGHDDYRFDPPRERRPGGGQDDEEDPAEVAEREGVLVADKLALTTDAQGAATINLGGLPALTRPSDLVTEVSFNDPNGEVQTVATRTTLWPSAVVPGIRTTGWASSRGAAQFTALALDTAGKPLAGQALQVRARLAQVSTQRTRVVGGFYAYDNQTAYRDLGVVCSGQTDDRGQLDCRAEFKDAGETELVVEAADSAGRRASAAASVWVTRQGELWFAQDNDDRIDLLPEKKAYAPGETARLQLRMPYREATALVAIEREGVIDTRVVTLRGNDPTIELKIEPGWAPNVYVSVLALRGRIREVPWYSFFSWGWREPLSWVRAFWFNGREYQAPTAMVDLAKPSFKLGVAALKVGLGPHTLDVSVTPDQPQYGVRQKASVKVRVTQGGQPLAGTVVAFAAVDEGLLALRDNPSWNLLDAMLQARPWGVETSTAQGEIVGRRHHGRKAVAAGGGGGRGGARELFDTLLLWRPDVLLDAKGEAVIEVPLNDSLTSFRFVAVADSGPQKFGTGSATVRVTQDLQLLPGLPPVVRDGDEFLATLTLRNTTARELQVKASLQGTVRTPGAVAPEFVSTPMALAPQALTLAAGAARELSWLVRVPPSAFSITWQADAQGSAAGAGSVRDSVKVTQQVVPAVPLRVTQASLSALDGSLTLPVAAPADALDAAPAPAGVVRKRGGVQVGLQPRLTGALPGLRRYWETYPYACLEQNTSKAIGLGDRAMWAKVAEALPTYLDRDGLANYFPPGQGDAANGSDRLTAYLVSATHEAGYAVPGPALEQMLQGLTAFVDGRIERRGWSPRPDLAVRKLAAVEALSRHGRAQARMLGAIELTPRLWPTAALIDWLRILQRVDGVPDRAARREEAQQLLRARLTLGGTTLSFSTEAEDHWWWLMDNADANAARLILAVMDEPAWKDDLPKLVVAHLARQRGGAWSTTTANLWGALALDKFAVKFESTPVSGVTRLTTLDGPTGPAVAGAATIDWAKTPAGGQAALPWPTPSGRVSVSQQGGGRPWVSVQTLAAVVSTTPTRAGYSLTRTVSAVEQKDPSRWSKGDVMRVRLDVEANADMTWVVVSDPVPGGATVLGNGLGRDSALAARGERREGSAWPAYEERSFEAFRRYFAHLPRGKHVVEYTVRLNNPGRFQLPPSRVEAMYAPETFGELPNAAVEVAP